MTDYMSFCSLFYDAHYLPIALYRDGIFVCASGFYEAGDPYPFVLPKLQSIGSPAIYTSSDTGYYGMVNAPDGVHSFVLGPAYSTAVTDGFIRSFMNKNAISPSRYGEIASFLSGIPQYTYNRFMNLLLYLHFSLTGEKLDFGSAFHVTDPQYQTEIGRQHSEHYYQVREEHFSHGTYDFEQQMLALIREGEPAKLQAFFMTAANAAHIREGKLAETPLRQAKNLFIGLVTMVGKFAAIPGGMDIEQCYQLIDTYIQECENLQTEEAVKNLQYNMPLDFANRVAQQKRPSGLSPETHAAMEYIATHINEPIGAEDVVAHSGKSRAYLFDRFHRELGMGIGAYILDCRLREARTLLKYTDKSLGEISNYLCFSSQAHFQNTFKKHNGVTPMEYRRSVQNLHST